MLICSYLTLVLNNEINMVPRGRVRSVMLNYHIYAVDPNTHLTLALVLGITLLSPLEGYKDEVITES